MPKQTYKKTKHIPKSRRAHLVHHRHTARLLHRRHTSYPLVALMLLCSGVYMFFATVQTKAADVTVTGRVTQGPAPSVPATIVDPVNGQQFTAVPIPVIGTCDPGFIVRVYRNDLFSGSALCSPQGQFSITTDLFSGTNVLRARIFNAADIEGPASPTVTVSYNKPVAAESSTPESEPERSPFYITSEFLYYAVRSQKQITWKFSPIGGKGPYVIRVVWGDGSSDEQSGVSSDGATFAHSYGTPSQTRESYPVSITAIDANGRQAYLQVFTIVNDAELEAVFQTAGNITAVQEWQFLRYLWPAYIMTLLIGVAFWLGERRGMALSTRLSVRRVKRVY